MSTIKSSDLKTLVSPLTGCFQNSCYLTTVTNSLYSLGLATAITGGVLLDLDAALQTSSPATGTAALDALLTALAAAGGISGAEAVSARATFTPQSTSSSPTQYIATNWQSIYATNAADAVFKEAATVAADGSTPLLVRGHISINWIIDIVIVLAPALGVTCTTTCPTAPGPTPTPTTDCGPDDTSSSGCDNRYGYNFPFFPTCDTSTWKPL